MKFLDTKNKRIFLETFSFDRKKFKIKRQRKWLNFYFIFRFLQIISRSFVLVFKKKLCLSCYINSRLLITLTAFDLIPSIYLLRKKQAFFH